ncbi:MAG TPA: type IX secretion system membrane protein PorP/SprF [Bacteroidales bacterium]|jgi:type IX secretion system PorP/SprF family membrane protein|nr:type IX secretion system membrane protein PorP/SprF [Bacteroidales bacterium]
MKRRVLYLVFFALLHQIPYAQQLPLYSQYLCNKFLINPASAGSDGLTTVNITAREQWIGYSGAPRTYSVSYQSRILKRGYRLKQNIFNKTVFKPKNPGKIGFGGYVFSDRNGRVMRTGFQMAYSYHTWIADYTQLSLGLAFTGYHFMINTRNINFEDPNEPWLNNELRRGMFVPDADFGFYILNPDYCFGFSCQQLFEANAKLGEYAYNNYWMDRHYYMFGSCNFHTGVKTVLQPSALLKVSEQVRPQLDLGFTYNYNNDFWAGISYRTGSALIASIGMRYFSSRVKLTSMYMGYSFDFTLNKIQRVTYGTHELTLAIKFGDANKRFNWVDRF